MTEPALCTECRDRPKWRPRHRCVVCYYRHRPIGERIEEAHRRLAMVPVELRRARVPKTSWPDGERWCASCQSFVPLIDCRGSMCVPCASERQHGAMIEKTYGLDAKGYEDLLALQGGRCAICRNKPGKKRFAVDHDHQTGVVRGLLCSTCNHDLLGSGHDSAARLLAAWHYLNTPPATGAWTKPEEGLSAPVSGPSVPEVDDDTFGGLTLDDAPAGARTIAVPVPVPSLAEVRKMGMGERMDVMRLLEAASGPAPF